MIEKPETKTWKTYVFEDIFDIQSSLSSIDKNKLSGRSGKIPYLTRSDQSNGYYSFVGEQSSTYQKDEQDVITIGLDTQTVFYQPSSFFSGQNIQVLRFADLNKYTAFFLLPLIRKQMEKFNWGGNGATLTRLRRSKILLPISEANSPDYKYMREYAKQKEQELIQKYTDLVKNKLEGLKNIKEVELSEKEWGEFLIEELFTINSGVRLIKSDMKLGKRPFIGASDSNNGITGYVSNTNASLDKNVLGVNYNGSVVDNFYHQYEAIFSDDVKRLSFKNMSGNKYSYLFVKNQTSKQKGKYQYGYKFNASRMYKQKLLLPVRNGDPDYEYMENYMKQLEYRKLKKYLEYKSISVD